MSVNKKAVNRQQSEYNQMLFYDTHGLAYDTPGVFYDGFVVSPTTKVTMAKVKLNLARLNPEEKVAQARTIHTQMTGNPDFVTPDPPLSLLELHFHALETAIENADVARQASVHATTLLNEAVLVLDGTVTEMGSYVQKASGGVASKIQSAGMSIRATAAPITGLPQVGNLSVSAGDDDGEIDGNFDPVRGSKSYEVESSLDPITTGGWTHRAILTASKFTIADLTSGTRMWFRVRAIGPNKIKGAWSDPAVKVVP